MQWARAASPGDTTKQQQSWAVLHGHNTTANFANLCHMQLPEPPGNPARPRHAMLTPAGSGVVSSSSSLSGSGSLTPGMGRLLNMTSSYTRPSASRPHLHAHKPTRAYSSNKRVRASWLAGWHRTAA